MTADTNQSEEHAEPNKGGRPKIDIDEDKVYQAARMMCTNVEIADMFGCSTDTIERRFAGVLQLARSEGKRYIRRKQFDKMEEGSESMLKWLGIQYLGQSDKVTTENTNREFVIDDNDGAALGNDGTV